MEPDEVDNQLEELEIRVERLRALYEQYFLGIEKIEPAVPRKDVDRRIWVLRRTQIRNTAKRFRLHNIIQRYNTFQQYWQRICRDIENGTYTRHLLRAVKRLGEEEALTIATRRRFGRRRGESEPAQPGASLAAVEAELQAELRRLSEAPPAQDEDDDLFRDLVPSAPPLLPLVGAFAPHSVPPSPAMRQPGPRPLPPPPLPARVASKPPAVPPPPPVRVSGRAPSPRSGQPPGPIRGVGPPPVPSRAPPIGSVPPVKPAGPGPVGLWMAPGDPMARPRAQLPQVPVGEKKNVPATPTSAALSDRQLHDLHSRLMQARDRTGDRTRVTVEALAKTVDSAAAKLRQQHGQHRRIEFEVVIKDGKAVVRPIVR